MTRAGRLFLGTVPDPAPRCCLPDMDRVQVLLLVSPSTLLYLPVGRRPELWARLRRLPGISYLPVVCMDEQKKPPPEDWTALRNGQCRHSGRENEASNGQWE